MFIKQLLFICLLCFFVLAAKANFYAKEIPIINEKEMGAIKCIYKDKVNRYIVATARGIYIQKDNKFFLLKQNQGFKINCLKLVITNDFLLICKDSLNNFYSAPLSDIDNIKWLKNVQQHIVLYNQMIGYENETVQQWFNNYKKPIAYKAGFFKDSIDQLQLSNCIVVKYLNNWYELVSKSYNYITDTQFSHTAPRAVFPINDNAVLVSFDEDKSLFIYNLQQHNAINICKQNKQVLSGLNATTFLHAFKGANNDVFLLGANSKVYNLSLTNYTITLVEELNALRLDLKNLSVAPNNTVFFGTYKGDVCQYNYVTKQVKVYNKEVYNGLSDVYRLYVDAYGLVWVGMAKGFAVINPKVGTVFIPTNTSDAAILNGNVTAFARIKNDVWLGSYQNGLWHVTLPTTFNDQINLNGVPFTSLFESNKNNDNNIKFINVKNDTLIIRTVNNINVLTTANKLVKQISLDDEIGTPLQNQYNYLMGNNYVSGISNGFCVINDITTPNSSNTIPTIEEIVTINFTKLLPYNWVNNATLTLNDDDGYISFTPSFYNSAKNKKPFVYTIDGKLYNSLSNGSAIILLPKSNAFNITLYEPYSNADKASLSFTIKVNIPWYKSLVFKIMIAAILLGLIGLIFYLRRRSNQFKMAATINEITSLRGQLNPHFISNSLNSINAFVLQNKSEQASDYIVKFAKLMHLILQNSTQEFITIADEINMLQTYLEMEKLRFKDKFTYAIHSKVANDQYLIPSMILQPFVENAIWHGLLQQKLHGILQIDIEPLENNVLITITDNGIGRKASEALKSKQTTNRKSYGMQIVQKRIVLLEKIHQRKYNISIIDLQNPTGTQVKLIL